MTYTPQYIAAYDQESGLYTYSEPFLAPEKSYPILNDAYCWRGRVIQKKGSIFLGRLRRRLLTQFIGNITEAWGGAYPHDETFNIFTLGLSATEPYAQLQPGTVASPLTIVIGAPISQTLIDITGTGTLSVSGVGPITAAQISYNTGDLILTFSGPAGASAATITAYYYPGLPVMGCRTQELPSINDEGYIFFDKKYAYRFDTTARMFEELTPIAPTTWNGSDSDFFWSTNYAQDATGDLFWATNDNMTGSTRDPLRYYNTATWTDFTPAIDASNTMYNARVILPFKGRLVAFNTWEGTTAGTITTAANFSRRARWSAVGSPIAANAWRSDIIGQGSYLDAPTSEAIVGVEYIKDTMVVKFERSSWKFVYTGNEVLPFVFQKINTELGAESSFCLVPFDRGVFAVSNYGITTDDSVNVSRIDLQIPDTTFKINNLNSGLRRIQGVRDFYNELVYWAYPTSIHADKQIYPNNVLVYNYRNNTYATFLDSYTCFGYFQYTLATWAHLPYTSWSSWNDPWNSGTDQALFPDVAAGTQHGFVELISKTTSSTNGDTLFILGINTSTQVLNVPNHNLEDDDVIILSGIIGTLSSLNGQAFIVSRLDENNISINATIIPSDTYLGNGTISKVTDFYIATKRFAPGYESGKQCRLGYVDFLFEKTQDGQVTVDVYVDENDSISITDPISNPSLVGTNVLNTCPDNTTLIPFQQQQSKIWHRQSTQVVAQNFQVTVGLTPFQLVNLATADSYVILHAIALYISMNARLVQ